MQEEAADEALADESMDYEEIVREKFHPVRKCTVYEAAEEMENLGHTFFAFGTWRRITRSTSCTSGTDGGYGVIVPVDIDVDVFFDFLRGHHGSPPFRRRVVTHGGASSSRDFTYGAGFHASRFIEDGRGKARGVLAGFVKFCCALKKPPLHVYRNSSPNRVTGSPSPTLSTTAFLWFPGAGGDSHTSFESRTAAALHRRDPHGILLLSEQAPRVNPASSAPGGGYSPSPSRASRQPTVRSTAKSPYLGVHARRLTSSAQSGSGQNSGFRPQR